MEKRRQQTNHINPFNVKKAYKKILQLQKSYGLSQFDSNHWRTHACIKNPCLKPNIEVFTKSQSVKKIGLSTSGHYSTISYKVPSIKQQLISVSKKKIISKKNWQGEGYFKRYETPEYFDHFELFEAIKQCKNQKLHPKSIYQKYGSHQKEGRYKYQLKTQSNQNTKENKMNSLESLKRDILKIDPYPTSKPIQSRRPLTSQFKNSQLKKVMKQNDEKFYSKPVKLCEDDGDQSSNYEFNPWDVESFQYSQLEH